MSVRTSLFRCSKVGCAIVAAYLSASAKGRQEEIMNTKSMLGVFARPTRRELIASVFLAGCGSSLSVAAWGQSKENKMSSVPSSDANKSRTSLHQEIDFKAPAERIYQVLLSSK